MEDWKKDDELWELLGRARPVKVSPFFARRVRNSIPKVSPFRSLVLRWAGAAALAVVLVGFFASVVPDERTAATAGFESPEFIATYEALAGLDLIAVSDPVSAMLLEGM